MKINFSLLFILFFVGLLQAQQLKTMTYNIRLDVASDGENAWPERKDFIVSQLQFHEPDVLGTQEGLPHQVKYLTENLPYYGLIGQGRDGVDKGEYSAIFYNKGKFEIKDSGTFWLSETPDTISKGWDAAINRICTYALLEDKNSEKTFWVFNTHFDHVGVVSRQKAVGLILKRIKALNTAKLPVVVMGDLNVTPDSKVISLLNEQLIDTRTAARIHFGQEGTFNGFNYNQIANRRIDYIFVSKGFEVQKYATLTESKDLHFPSDHFPVLALVSF